MLNHITIAGRLTRDVETRVTNSGMTVVSFSVAVDRDMVNKTTGERGTDFIDCVAWDKRAEFIAKYFVKGSSIIVSGRLQIRQWEDKQGNKRRSAEINVENAYFAGSKRENDSQAAGGSQSGYSGYGGQVTRQTQKTPQNRPQEVAEDFAELTMEDAELPF